MISARWLDAAMGAAAATALGCLVAEYGFHHEPARLEALHAAETGAAVVFCALQFLKLFFVPRPIRFLWRRRFDFMLLFILGFQFLAAAWMMDAPEAIYLSRHGTPAPLAAATVLLIQIYFLATAGLHSALLQRLLLRLRLHPAQTTLVSFLALIAAGTALLCLPKSSAPGRATSLLDAAFTATSAACVTGLGVVDTGTHFSLLGQCVILGLIQVGGLGILTFTAFAALLSGRGLPGGEAHEISRLLEVDTLPEIRRALAAVFGLTLLIEALGAACLYPAMTGRVGDGFVAAYYAVFHAVSAFCNAGFALFPDSVHSFKSDSLAMASLCGLILAGSLGTGVLQALPRSAWLTARLRWAEIPRHARVVLAVNALLLTGGTAAFWALERNASMAGWDTEAALWGSIFPAVTARTCGYEIGTTAALGGPALALMFALMIVGGSPGSTAGGIKTTALAINWAALVGRLRGRPPVLAGKPLQAVETGRAAWVAAGMFAVLGVGTLLIQAVEGGADIRLAFEAVSAVGTVGLSMGVTPELSSAGKSVIILLMILGRVGPACLVLTWALRHPAIRPGRDSVLVG